MSLMPDSRPGSIVPRAGSIVHDSTTGQLVKRNREIAEVRDQLDKMNKRLSAGQARNKVLLEESSELDSEVFRQCDRCAISEQSTAELFDESVVRNEEQCEQEAKHTEALSNVRDKAEVKEAELRLGEAEATEEQRLADLAAAELAGLRATLDLEEADLAEARRGREEYTRPRGSPGPSQSATMAAEAEREVIDAQCDFEKATENCSRQRVTELEAEVSAESRRREELRRKLQQADAQPGGSSERLRDLEAAVAANGGNAAAILAEVRAQSDSESVAAERRPSKLVGDDVVRVRSNSIVLKEEVTKVQERRRSLQLDSDTLQEKADQDSDALQLALDGARTQLQRSLREAASRNSLEVSKLEAEVQRERQSAALEALAEEHAAERIVELKRARSEALSRSERAAESRKQSQLAEAARCSTLTKELSSVRTEMGAAEGRLAASSRRAAEADARRIKVEAEGRQRVAKVRGMIEKLWSEINSQASALQENRPSSLHVPAVNRRALS